MIRFWLILAVWNGLMAGLLASKGNEHYLIPFVTAAYCGYMFECAKEKSKKDSEKKDD